MLEVKDLVKKYGEKTAINGLNFHIRSGEVVGLLGLNGAGKSTTMNCMTGYIAPTSGTVIVGGHDIRKEPDAARGMIGYLPEVFAFYPEMKVKEYLEFVCNLKKIPGNKKAREEHIDQICSKVGLGDLKGRMIRNLSKGYKQRVGFAQALIGNPGVLILDEPTVGLDPSQIIEIRQLIKDSGKESTVIVSSHILSEIQAICSRILVIHDGHIVADGSPSQLMEGARQQELRIRIRDVKECTEKDKEQNEKNNPGADNERKTGQGPDRVLRKIPSLDRYDQMPATEEGTLQFRLFGNGRGDLREETFRAFAEAGIVLLELSMQEASLERTFLHLTGQDGETAIPDGGAGGQEAEEAPDGLKGGR